jgi:AcrR family transcriptional regulator
MATTPRDGAARQRPGRRVGDSHTRERILATAREQFARHGYAGASVRAIAAAAGVDPATVRHFYGSKDELFAATLQFPPQMPQGLIQALHGDPGQLGERFVRAYLSLWEDPATAQPLHAIVRSALTSPRAAGQLRAIFTAQAIRPFTAALGGHQPGTRAALAGTHLLGIAIARYIIRLEPLASMNREELVTATAPAIQRYLTAT